MKESDIGGAIPIATLRKKHRGQDFIHNIDQNSVWPGILKNVKANRKF